MHSHGHDHAQRGSRELTFALIVNVTIMMAEIIGGLLSGSLALLTDAGHMLVDATALAIALIAIRIARRPPDAHKTYGYHRAEILATLANGVLLAGLLLVLVVKATGRLLHPQTINPEMMTGVAFIGLLGNGFALVLLWRQRHRSPNLRAAYLHVISDTLSSIGVIVAGLVILWTGWHAADPIATLIIAAFILRQVWRLLAEAVNVLLEGAPGHLHTTEIREQIAALPGVRGVHDLHITTHTSDTYVLTAHIVLDEEQSLASALTTVAEIRNFLHDRHGIEHATIEIDTPRTSCMVREHCICEFRKG